MLSEPEAALEAAGLADRPRKAGPGYPSREMQTRCSRRRQ
jgi:hypothetical protein